MYERLPLDFIGITEDFGQNAYKFHYGVDLGWHDYQGEPIYAVHDSEVVYEGFDNNLGNYIVLKYDIDNNTIINRFLHMKNRANYKAGDKVKQKQIIGNMGTTGDSTGTHLHFEYWVCPKGYKYNFMDRSQYAKDPIKYCYLFEDQKASSTTINKLLKVVGTPTTKNEKISQIKVINKGLNARSLPSLSSSIFGYINLGYYDILDKAKGDGYTWYKVSKDKWVANTEDVVVYEITEKEDTNKKDPLANYNKFICKKDGLYYIYLNKDEIIYYPK